MGTKLKSVDMAHEVFFRRGSVELESKAAGGCLKKAALDPKQVGILINTGVYRDRHLVEPAMSSFIQRKIGANEEFDGRTSTFSFDLTNGGCGMVTGIMVADGFLRSGLSGYGLVVAGDAEPVPGLSDGYNIEGSASAVLLAAGEDDGEGFVAFRTSTDTRYLSSSGSSMVWTGEKKKQNRLVLQSVPSYPRECAACALDALQAFMGEQALSIEDIDLLVPSQSPPGFIAEFGKVSGLGDKIIDVTGLYGNVHTAGVGMALCHAVRDGRFEKARHVVLLNVGVGITTALALYRNRV